MTYLTQIASPGARGDGLIPCQESQEAHALKKV